MFDQKMIYLPVITGKNGFMTQERADEIKASYDNKEVSWWSSNPIYPYDGLLMSAFYGVKPYPKRKSLDLRDDVIFFGDSGGYQLLVASETDPKKFQKLKSTLNPRKVIAWQQETCNIGMVLDVPVKRSFPFYTRHEFESKLAQSKKNGDIMRELHTKKSLQLFNVIHGKTLEDMNEWRKTTEQDYSFDGYSLVTDHPETLAMDLGFAMEHFEGSQFHILGVSGIQSLILIAHANRYMKTTIYFDSSSYSVGNSFRRYINPFDFGGPGFSLLSEDGEQSNRFESIFCSCPICAGLNKPSDLWANGTKSGTLISVHNLYHIVQYTKMIEEVARNTETWEVFVRRHANEKTKRFIAFLNDVYCIGLDDAYIKHFDKSTQKMDDWL